MNTESTVTKPLWLPSEEQKPQTAMWQFTESTQEYHNSPPDDYAALHDWSIKSPNQFYSSLWDFLEIIGDKGEVAYLANGDIKKAAFYPEARLNYAENLLRNPDDRPAIIAHRDDGDRRVITRKELYDQVSRLVQALQAEGLKEGDRVAAIVCNDIEAIVGYLATAAIGAIWSSCSPDFGPNAASDRLGQIDPSVLFAVSHYSYSGKHFDVSPTIKAIADTCQLKKIILINQSSNEQLEQLPCINLEDFLNPFAANKIVFNRLPYSAPLAILFSSGTTGQPKCIIHSGMGLLIQHKKEQMLHCDLKKNERFFYFTTCGWMMWNWLVSGLALEATLVTYDGNPFYPRHDHLLDIIDEENINVFGTSAKYIDACQNFKLTPQSTHSLDTVRLILSTGSPLIPSNFDYIYENWKSDAQLASISGGTDICACFVGGNPLLPVYRGEIQCRFLGLDVDVLDDLGNSVTETPGELVCRNAHLSMPLGFWGDKDGSRYHDAYFDRFPGLWAHGDYVEKRPNGGFVINGRSDTTLNPGGVRIGTAEIYRQVESITEVEESIAIGQDLNGDQRVILFVILAKGKKLDEELIAKIKSRIRQGATPRHVPALIIAVDAIPRTRSGKISEVAVRDTIHGRKLKNVDALANPEALDCYVDMQELKI